MLLYYITDRTGFEGNNTEQRAALLRCVAEAACAGVDYIQLREKDLSTVDLELLAAVRVAWFGHSKRPPVIGVSAHHVADIQLDETDGADFAVLAPIFEKAGTSLKGIGLQVLHHACTESRLPVLALGGVNIDNARGCLDAGAAGLAGIRLFQQGNLAETMKRLRELSEAT